MFTNIIAITNREKKLNLWSQVQGVRVDLITFNTLELAIKNSLIAIRSNQASNN